MKLAIDRKFNLKENLDVLVAFGVIGIVLMIIIPLPKEVIDVLLALNITLSIVIILITMFTTSVLQLSVFPTLLLVTTLFRLALNISSTRLILSEADAGTIITAFGNFVIRGNYVVGIVIFLIIVVIQFMVITNGAGRVAEVSARFTLDAMPGKQMSIDADLNSGMIDEATARKRRQDLQSEADFYGSANRTWKSKKKNMSGRVSLWHREDAENTDISLQRRHSQKRELQLLFWLCFRLQFLFM